MLACQLGGNTAQLMEKFLRDTYPELDDGQEFDILASASKIAIHAIVASHQKYENYIPFYFNNLDSNWPWDF